MSNWDGHGHHVKKNYKSWSKIHAVTAFRQQDNTQTRTMTTAAREMPEVSPTIPRLLASTKEEGSTHSIAPYRMRRI